MSEAGPVTDGGGLGGRRGLFAALGVALVVRALGFFWGLPGPDQLWSFHPDEYRIVDAARRVVSEPTLHPTRFQYGSLTVYLTALVGAPLAWVGALEGPGGWHLVGRAVSLLAGLVTVAATWTLARRLLGAPAATVAALALAVAPGHVLLSAWATPDAPATAFVVLTLAVTVRGVQTGAPRDLLLAGVCAGLAAGVKYSAGMVALAPIAAALAAVETGPFALRLRRAFTSGVASLVTFAAVTPHAFLSSTEFLRDLEYELILHPRHGHGNLFEATGDGWTHHLLANLPFVLGWPLVLAALAGLVVLARRGGRAGWIVVGFAVLTFGALGTSEVRFMRYLTPLAPVLCVAAAALLAGPGARLGRVRIAVAALVVGYAGLLSALQGMAMAGGDPRSRALEALERELPPGARIATTVVPTFFHPPFVSENGGPKIKPRFDERLAAGDSAFAFPKPTKFDPAALVRARADAFVLSEFDWREEDRLGDADAARFLGALESTFGPPRSDWGLAPRWRVLFGLGLRPVPHDWLYPFQELRVYSR